MPLFMETHYHVKGLTANAVASAHQAELKAQEKYGVRYLRYWFDEERHNIFYLVEASTREAAAAFDHETHGLVADEIIQVSEDV
jgi:hypothetical protein